MGFSQVGFHITQPLIENFCGLKFIKRIAEHFNVYISVNLMHNYFTNSRMMFAKSKIDQNLMLLIHMFITALQFSLG